MIGIVEFKKAVETVLPTNHVFVADVSGSMYNTLPKMRQHLKDSLAMLVKPQDTVSILYFSSRGQYGTVFAGETIQSLQDLTKINAAIDRFLKPMGCTGFVEPLKHACDVADELSFKNGNLNSLVFMTDGYDNCWSTAQILNACTTLPLTFNNITFLEYGWYCNRELLEQMAEATNAIHSFAETYDDLQLSFDQAMTQQAAKRMEVEAQGSSHVVYLDNGKVCIVNVANGVALVPENIEHVWTLNELDEIDPGLDDQTKYVALYYAVHRMNPDLAWNVLRVLGDVHIAKLYQNCFTKQDYTNVKNAIADAIFNEDNRFIDGVNYDVVPDENAPTVLDVLELLVKNNAMLNLKSQYFAYNRTGRKTVQKADTKTLDLANQIAEADSAEERLEIAKQLVDVVEWTPKFETGVGLVSMTNLVYNNNRPNISINTVLPGYVDVPDNVIAKYPTLPSQLETKIYRNYTVVKDGIINMLHLPVIVEDHVAAQIAEMGVTALHIDDQEYLIDLSDVPLVNRAMTKNISGQRFCEQYVQLQLLKARQKVFKAKRDELVGKTNAAGLADLYGKDAAGYLSEHGIRDYGFSPKSVREESTDVYVGKELNIKIKGMSALPSLAAVQKKLDAGKKLNAGDNAIYKAMEYFQTSSLVVADDDLEDWIVAETNDIISQVRVLEKQLSAMMYGVVVGKRWFSDIDFETPKTQVTVRGDVYDVELVLEEKEFKI